MKEHDNRRRAINICIRENKLKLSPENCDFLNSHVTNKGHVLTPEGTQPTLRKSVQWKSCLPAPRKFLKSKHFSILYNTNPIRLYYPEHSLKRTSAYIRINQRKSASIC